MSHMFFDLLYAHEEVNNDRQRDTAVENSPARQGH